MIRIVEAPGIEGDHVWRVAGNSKGGRSLVSIGPRSNPGKSYFYVVQERERVYPFGTCTDVHYNMFASRDDAEEYASWFRQEVTA